MKRQMRNGLFDNKKGQFQVASSVMWGIVAFCLTIIVGLIVLGILINGGFFTAASAEQNLLNNLSANVTAGLNSVVTKFPVIFTVVGAVILLAVVGLLILIVSKFRMNGGNAFGQ